MYDYIIVGGGPVGLTLSLYLSKINKVLLIEKESSLGGCHRVKRENGIFTEHGPRLYMGNYKNTEKILHDLGVNWEEIFTRYNIDLFSIGNENVLKNFTFKDVMIMFYGYILYTIGLLKQESVFDFYNRYDFSEKGFDFMDRLCRMLDGGDIKSFSVYNFYLLADQSIFYKPYQPKLPNDRGLFDIWKRKLEENKVDIMLDTKVYKIHKHKIYTDNGIFEGEKIIFALPPLSMLEILDKSNMKDAYPNIESFAKKTKYLQYISITFHWRKKFKINKNVVFDKKSDLGILYVALSDFTNFENEKYKTVISTAISFVEKIPKNISREQLKIKVFEQLKLCLPDLPNYDFAIISAEKDTAFMDTKNIYINPQSKIYKHIYTVGTHNGAEPHIAFTSMESAIVNSLSFLNNFEGYDFQIDSPFRFNTFLLIVFIIIFIIFLFLKFRK